MKSSTAILAIALAASSASALAQTPTPMVHAGGATKVTDHVFVISDDNVPAVPNVGIIVGKKGMLVVDTGLGRRNGEIVLEEARRVGGNKLPLYLVTTHIHPEHDLGAQAFPPSTKMIRSRTQVDEIAEIGQQTADAFRKRSDKMRELLEGAEFRKADVVFAKEHDLNLGGVHVKLLAMGSNHTPGDTAIWVVEDKLLFAGDIAMKGMPAFASPKSSLNHWLESLDRLQALKPIVVVPSHGPLGDTSFIANYRDYLTAVRERTAALKAQGKSLEETTPLVTADLKEKYSDSGRMAGAIRTAYTEAKQN